MRCARLILLTKLYVLLMQTPVPSVNTATLSVRCLIVTLLIFAVLLPIVGAESTYLKRIACAFVAGLVT